MPAATSVSYTHLDVYKRQNQQRVIERHDFHDGFAGLDHSSHRGDVDALYGSPHRRTQLGSCHTVAARVQGFPEAGQFDMALVQLVHHGGADFRLSGRDALLGLLRGALGAGNGCGKLGRLPLKVVEDVYKRQVWNCRRNRAACSGKLSGGWKFPGSGRMSRMRRNTPPVAATLNA